ncbi:MAG: hypothetical protein LBE91_14870 [Tannerella sp.]|nr:hypothetical protein [Tannerella sp.]
MDLKSVPSNTPVANRRERKNSVYPFYRLPVHTKTYLFLRIVSPLRQRLITFQKEKAACNGQPSFTNHEK